MMTVQKHWFHGTTKETWRKIKEKGRLGGNGFKRKSEIFLARNLKQLIWFMNHQFPTNGDMFHRYELILSVKYIPNGVDDYTAPKPYNWEMIVKKPILLENMKVLRYI